MLVSARTFQNIGYLRRYGSTVGIKQMYLYFLLYIMNIRAINHVSDSNFLSAKKKLSLFRLIVCPIRCCCCCCCKVLFFVLLSLPIPLQLHKSLSTNEIFSFFLLSPKILRSLLSSNGIRALSEINT